MLKGAGWLGRRGNLIYLILFFHAFLAGSILPFPSEATLVSAVLLGEGETIGLLAAASAGNILGAASNWYLGRYCLRWQHKKWFPVSADKLEKATRLMNKYGYWLLLFSWVAILGDPLTFAAGVLRLRFAIFLPLVAVGKIGRYALVIYAAEAFG